LSLIIQFTPEVDTPVPLVAPSLSGTEAEATPQNTLTWTPTITQGGTPITPDSLSIDTDPVNGTSITDGLTVQYTPNDGFHGVDSFTYFATLAGQQSNSAPVTAIITVPRCTELGRTTRQYVSGYTLSRVAITRVRRSSQRCVVANFNGAIDPARTIASVDWETTAPWSINMSNPRIESSKQRETMVDVFFNFAGWGGLKATVTLDNGEIYNAEFSFTVLDNPLYPSAIYPLGNGPFKLTATA
jgi:hypothetical protein